MLEKEAQDWGRGLWVCTQEFLIMSHVPDLSLKPIRWKNMPSLKIHSEVTVQGIILKDEGEQAWSGPPLHLPGVGISKQTRKELEKDTVAPWIPQEFGAVASSLICS